MKFTLPIFALSLLGSAQAEEDIVGGSTARKGQFPYQVSLQRSSHFCGGSIISPSHILTAAHCVVDQKPKGLKVRAGSTQHASGGVLAQVSDIVTHSGYSAKTIENDIAILKIAQNLTFGDTIAKVDLPSTLEGNPKVGTKCAVTGWGTTSAGASSIPANLQFTYLDTVDLKSCQKQYESKDLLINDSNVCAGKVGGGKDACQGDSGGPLVDTKSNKQVGVVSSGYSCAHAQYSGVYMSTSAYAAWIDEQMMLLS